MPGAKSKAALDTNWIDSIRPSFDVEAATSTFSESPSEDRSESNEANDDIKPPMLMGGLVCLKTESELGRYPQFFLK